MVYHPHEIVKAQKLSAAYVPLVADALTLPTFMARQSVDIFKGALGDTVTMKVPGVLPAHDYEFRNNRADPIIVDQFTERTIDVTIGGNAYSAVALTDEQKDFDLLSWGDIMPMQADAVAEYLNRMAAKLLAGEDIVYPSGKRVEGAEPAAVIGVAEGDGNMRKAIFGARSLLNSFRTGTGARTLVVGANFEMALHMDDKLTLGDQLVEATSEAARAATIGRVAGFNVVVDQTIDPDLAYAFTSNAFFFFNGAPSVPNSIAYGTTVASNGLAMRHLIDYDQLYFQDRSSVNTWYGFAPVTDTYRLWEDATMKAQVGESENFTRMIRLELGGTPAYNGGAELTAATNVDQARVASVSSTSTP